jgi:hypothetical protein
MADRVEWLGWKKYVVERKGTERGKRGGFVVDDTIYYINTDLDLTSADDLTALTVTFKAGGTIALHCGCYDDGLWYATFEREDYDQSQPEPAIAAMLEVVESLNEPLRAVWLGCTRREFNIGYVCGSRPWAYNQDLTSLLLGRIAAAGASLRITLYPPAREKGELPMENLT